jgi:DNA-binding transcriptional LysR family regulator
LELRQLELFVGVANELHFGRAAERLFIAQSALSQHIRRLEKEVGVELFDRGKRNVRLTPAGTAFYAEARRVLERAECARRAARASALGRGGLVEVAYVSTTAPKVLAGLVDASRSASLGEVRLHERTAPRIESDLDEDLIDVAVIDGPVGRKGLEALTLDDEPLVTAVHPASELAARSAPTVSDLRHHPFVLPSATWAPRLANTIAGACQHAGFRPEVMAEVDSPHGWMVAVVAGGAVSLVPASLAARWEGDARVVPLAGPAPRAVTLLVWRTGAPPHVHALAERVAASDAGPKAA